MITSHKNLMEANTQVDLYDLMVKPDEQRRLHRIEIELHPDAWKLEVKVRYERRRIRQDEAGTRTTVEMNVVDIGLEDENGRSIGWSGSERTEIFVTENLATPGYHPTRLNGQLWKLQLGLYRQAPEGFAIEVEIRQYLPERRWLIGETHSHSLHSDGRMPVSGLRAVAESVGLDYIWLTDHNTQSGCKELVSDEKLLMLPGMELTWYGGHANVYGLRDSRVNYFARTKDDVNGLLRRLREEGAIVSLNHAFEPGMNWTYGLENGDTDFDLLEIWNGPWHKANQDALLYWHRELARGRRIIVTGGSDAHKPGMFRTIGSPALAVLADSRTESGILEAMVHGRSNILMMPDFPLLRLRSGNHEMGDTVPPQEQTGRLTVETRGTDPAADEILFYNEGGPFLELKGETIPQGRDWTKTIELPEGTRFVFALLKRSIPVIGPVPGTITNPIFFQ